MAALHLSLLVVVAGSLFLLHTTNAAMLCSPHPATRMELVCGDNCCESHDGAATGGYYCCGPSDKTPGKVVEGTKLQRVGIVAAGSQAGTEGVDLKARPERFATYNTAFQIDYTLLVIGLIVSIIVSILLSFLCCLLCNGCWLHRQRNPHMYETVNDSGWYPICCGFGIPLGTVVFSTHPPQFANHPGADAYYNGSTASIPSSRNNPQRVRFNEDGTPKGVLKHNGNEQGPHHPEQHHFA